MAAAEAEGDVEAHETWRQRLFNYLDKVFQVRQGCRIGPVRGGLSSSYGQYLYGGHDVRLHGLRFFWLSLEVA